MAGQVATGPPSRPSGLVRCIALILLSLIVVAGLTVLIVWLAVKPKKLVYSVEDALIKGYNLTNDNHLNASISFHLRAYNPNSKVSIYYDKIDASVYYDDEILASTTLSPFYQPHRNVTRLGLGFVAQQVGLYSNVAQDLKLERTSGEVELDVKIRARIRLKVGIWKSRHRTLKITCSPVVINFSKAEKFERTSCDVDL
ncbi:uncharacterized protein At1g08160-like [Impatiens glandulifera]|uniref:uncharacterized protein At1g08160-like n=1 Tax=Impatiens glandulifera TaxID=253017 RepID=UPI001FB05D98|nr:uncharacterized protein At1g08160-like [Impatiens glandulifera]